MNSRRNLEIYQGDDFSHTINLYDTNGDLFAFGNQHNFDGKIRRAGKDSLSPPGAQLAVITCSKVALGGGFEPGKIVLSINRSITRTLPPGRHWYQVRFLTGTSAPFTILTLISGLAIVYPEVTKDT